MAGKTPQSCPMSSFGAAVYHIWRLRNDVKFGNPLISEEKLVQRICWEVRSRILWKGRFKNNDLNKALCARWNIPLSVLV